MSAGLAARVTRVIAIVIPLACAGYGLARPDDLFVGGAAWLVVLAACLAGYGHVVERLARVSVDVGLRLGWGCAACLAVAGWFLAAGALGAPVLAALIIAGIAGHVWRQLTAAPPLRGFADRVAWARSHPHAAAFYALIAAIAIVNVIAALAKLDGNVYDDDVIYTPMVRRLLDIGDIDEPFSFRRISAYGGQTVLQAMAAVRGTLANLHLVDGALCQIIVLLLIAGMASARAPERAGSEPSSADRGPRGDEVVVGLVLLVVVLLPNTSVNTGSYWSGVVLFLALYRTLAMTALDDASASPAASRRTTALFAIAGVLAAAVCTLRQSYLPVAVLFLALVLLLRLVPSPRQAMAAERGRWLAALAGGALALVPYCIATWRSNLTFLFPLWPGTFNQNVPTLPPLFTPWQELQFFFKVAMEPDPFRVTVPLLPVLFLVRDRRRGRPLTAFIAISLLGFVMLVHSFLLSDSRNLWRYSFGYSTALLIVLMIEAGALGLRRDDASAPVHVPLVGRIVIVACLLIQIPLCGLGIRKKYADLGADLQAAVATFRRPIRAVAQERLYQALQRSAPDGAAIAILLDEPYHFDYARNRFFNIDTPGFASLPPGMPFFRGPDAVASYFQDLGIRYLAFVRGRASRYMFRRDYWVQRLFWENEFWQAQGAYAVDCTDNFEALAAERAVLFEQDGLVMVDLAVRR